MKITQRIDRVLWPYLRSGRVCATLMVAYFLGNGVMALLMKPLWLVTVCDVVALAFAMTSVGSRHRYVLWRDSLTRASQRRRMSQ